METKNKISEIAKFIVDNYDGFHRFYTPTYCAGEISDFNNIGDIQIQASQCYEYVDILGLTKDEQNELGLTKDEQNELEVKITELKNRKKK